MHNKKRKRGLLYGLLGLPFFLLLVGCGGANSAGLQRDITRVEMAITEAQEADAEQHAPLELRLAHDNLQDARKAFTEKEYDKARRFVEKALVDAKLAEATARAEKTKQTAQQLRESIETLNKELIKKEEPDQRGE